MPATAAKVDVECSIACRCFHWQNFLPNFSGGSHPLKTLGQEYCCLCGLAMTSLFFPCPASMRDLSTRPGIESLTWLKLRSANLSAALWRFVHVPNCSVSSPGGSHCVFSMHFYLHFWLPFTSSTAAGTPGQQSDGSWTSACTWMLSGHALAFSQFQLRIQPCSDGSAGPNLDCLGCLPGFSSLRAMLPAEFRQACQ